MNFEWKHELMKHKKTNLPEKVINCMKYENDNCHFGSNCWFHHKDDMSLNTSLESENKKSYINEVLKSINERISNLERNI